MSPPKVVIVGGGVAGAAAAQSLHGSADVTVVDRCNLSILGMTVELQISVKCAPLVCMECT